jgi:hypothetical protein
MYVTEPIKIELKELDSTFDLPKRELGSSISMFKGFELVS